MNAKKAKFWRKKAKILCATGITPPYMGWKEVYSDMKRLLNKGVKRPDIYLTGISLLKTNEEYGKLLMRAGITGDKNAYRRDSRQLSADQNISADGARCQ